MKTTLFTLIFGIALAVIFVIVLASDLSTPNEIARVNVSDFIFNLLTVCMGTFLIFRSIQRKSEDLASLEIVPDSPEDIQVLNRKQSRVFAYVLFVLFIGSIEVWTLNNYSAGWTVLNLAVIFDLVANLILAFFAVQLFRGKAISKLLLYTVILYSIGSIIFFYLREEWFGAVVQLLVAFYFIFALVRPLNRKTYKISHMVVLPVVIVLSIALSSFDAARTDKMWDDFIKSEQEYLTVNTATVNAYIMFLENETPIAADIEDVRKKMKISEEKVQSIVLTLPPLKEEYQKQYTTEDQILTLEEIEYNQQYYNVILEQSQKVQDLLDFSDKLNFENLSDEEQASINALVREIEDFNGELNEIGLKISKVQERFNE